MPRQARIKSESGIYHIMIRGINRQSIFEDDEDCEKFFQTLKSYKEKCGYQIYAYCFMGNHIHLLLKVGADPLEQIMRRICGSYVYWFNRKYERVGNLFQDRFKSEPVENDAYLLTVVRYIHQNPIQAGIIKDISKYKWSSYNDYIEIKGLIDTTFVYSLFDEDKKTAADLFKKYMNELQEDNCLEMEDKHRVTDQSARELIKKTYGLTSSQAIQGLEARKRDAILKNLKEKGLSIRQIERLTGINRGVILRI